MINRAAINDRVREWGLREDIVEKDYVLGWLLWAIGSDPTLSATWVFKGGTCIKKCYIETYRFSEDLDFTVAPGGPLSPEKLEAIFQEMLKRVTDESGIQFAVRAPYFRQRPRGESTEGRIYYRGPRGAPQPASIKLDLSGDETIARPTVLRRIAHPHADELPAPAEVRSYGFEELFAEKLRALAERSRPRDLYDVVNLFRRRDLQAEPALIRAVLIEKCERKGIPVPSYTDLESSPYRAELDSEWHSMLAHQLPALPPLQDFWAELPLLFAWLDGTAALEDLPRLPSGTGEDEAWSPPPTVWTWEAGVPLETIRFAGANRLCVELDYQGTTRTVEPYALRRTRDGNLLLRAVRADTREPRSYRVDRMQGIRVTTRAFRPVYAVEFSQSGPIAAPPTTPGVNLFSRSLVPRHGRRSGRSGGTTFVIQCTACGKQFSRTRLDTVLRPHKAKMGGTCFGRSGYVVNTRFR
jgi:predicted nucleotidyltransferase component of viral defense system